MAYGVQGEPSQSLGRGVSKDVRQGGMAEFVAVMATSRAVPTVARNVENTMTNVPGLSSRRSNERNSIA